MKRFIWNFLYLLGSLLSLLLIIAVALALIFSIFALAKGEFLIGTLGLIGIALVGAISAEITTRIEEYKQKKKEL
jgi:hypothetical protein